MIKIEVATSLEGRKIYFYQYSGTKIAPNDEDWTMFGQMDIDEIKTTHLTRADE